MDILVIEDNLMWGPRLKQTISGLGHTPLMFSRVPDELPPAHAAILNLASERLFSSELVERLKSQGTYIIAHAGHKETGLLEAGKEAGCDQIVSNGSLTFKLANYLKKVPQSAE